MNYSQAIAGLVVSSILAALIIPVQSAAQNNVPNATMKFAYISAHPYEITPVKQAWNTILYILAPDYLAEIWPSDAYDLETVRSSACDSDRVDSNVMLGNKLTFVHQPRGMLEIPEVVGGVEVDLNTSAGLADFCTLLNSSRGFEEDTFQKLLVAYQAVNPPADGTWAEVRDGFEIPGDLVPLLQGEFAMESRGIPELYPTWRSTEGEMFLRWSAIDESNPSIDRNDVRVWAYINSMESGAPKYYVTYGQDGDLDKNSEAWRSSNSTFRWESPPSPPMVDVVPPQQRPILWGARNAQDDVPDSWYLVMNRALPYLTPDFRFEKFPERGPYIGFEQVRTGGN